MPHNYNSDGNTDFSRLDSFFKMLADNNPDLLWAKDLENRYIFANKAICEKLLIAESTMEPLGKTDLYFSERQRQLNPNNPHWHTFGENCVNSDEIVKNSKEHGVFEEFGYVKGKYLVLDVHKSPIWNDFGDMIGTVGSGRVVTDERLAAQELAEQKNLYRELFEASPNGIVVEDANGNIIDVNDATCKIFQYSRQELIGKNISIFTTPENEEIVRENIKKILSGEKLRQVLESKRKDGSTIYMALNESRIKLEDNNYGILSIAENITASKLAENALRESEERFKSMFKQNKAVMFVVDPQNNQQVIDANEAAVKFYGYPAEKLLTMNMGQINVLSEEKRAEMMKKALGRPDNYFIFKHKLANGEFRDVEVYASPLVQDGKKVMFVIVHDISERLAALNEVNRLATLVEQTVESVMITDLHGNIEYVNSGFRDTTGYSREEILGKNAKILKSGKHDQTFYKNIWDTILKGEKWRNVVINKKKDGSLYHGKALIFPIKSEDGKITNFAEILDDTTQEMNLEQQIAQLQKMEAIGTLSGGVAHDFNNILTVINGHAEIALMRSDSETKVHGDLVSILGAGKRAAKLTSQLLAFSRKQVYEPKVVNLNDLVINLEKMLMRLISEDINLNFDLTKDLPCIKADTGQIEQVIINLIINARDAINSCQRDRPHKNITLKTYLEEYSNEFKSEHQETVDGKYVVVRVDDNGTGMADEVKSRIFEPFFTTKNVDKGTGLGLSTVYGIVKQNKGLIEVQSELRVGTSFFVYWPAAMDDESPDSESSQNSDRTVSSGNETILLVEDDESVRHFAFEALNKAGYNILQAASGEEALKQVENSDKKIDLLITDIIMPGMHGKDLATKLADKIPEKRVLFVSGYPLSNFVEEGTFSRGVQFLQKPYSVHNLTTRIRNILELGK